MVCSDVLRCVYVCYVLLQVITHHTKEAYNSMKTRGSAVDAGIMLKRWMDECPDLGHVKYETKWIPLGPWESGVSVQSTHSSKSLKMSLPGANEEETRVKVTIGTLMRQNMKASVA